ncbi:MAG: PaaI family thioesterase [Candidatus Eisenbacteria bacterium]|nr:PaaI family thioesterase [Candidatus Eisenbacteria bacterium]
MTTEAPLAAVAASHHTRCILCGKRNPRSLRLSFTPTEKGAVTARLGPHPELQGYDGLLHGGVIAALLDGAMTHCLFHHGVEAVTGDLHVRFVRAVPCDVPVELTARTLSARPPLYRVRAELIADKRIMAWAEATFMRRQAHSRSDALRHE